MLADLVCPVSNVRVDRNAVRANGLITTALLVAYVITRSPWIVVPVGLDYAVRAQAHAQSPMAWFATAVCRKLGVPYRPMDKAPKVFASRIGVCFAAGAAITHFLAPATAPWLAGTLAVFTCLESVFDLCVGCVVYTYVALPLHRAREAVRRVPLFGGLDDGMLVAVANGLAERVCPAGTRIVTEGESGDRMYVVSAGEVEIFREAADGTRTILATQGRGSFFGELALLASVPRSASVRARTTVRLLTLGKADFEALMERHPGMRDRILRTAEEHRARDGSPAPTTSGA